MAEVVITVKDISFSITGKCPNCGFELRIGSGDEQAKPAKASDYKRDREEASRAEQMEVLPKPGQLEQLDTVARELAALRVLMFAHRREIDAELEEARRAAQQKTGEVLGRSINALSQIVAEMRERESLYFGKDAQTVDDVD